MNSSKWFRISRNTYFHFTFYNFKYVYKVLLCLVLIYLINFLFSFFYSVKSWEIEEENDNKCASSLSSGFLPLEIPLTITLLLNLSFDICWHVNIPTYVSLPFNLNIDQYISFESISWVITVELIQVPFRDMKIPFKHFFNFFLCYDFAPFTLHLTQEFFHEKVITICVTTTTMMHINWMENINFDEMKFFKEKEKKLYLPGDGVSDTMTVDDTYLYLDVQHNFVQLNVDVEMVLLIESSYPNRLIHLLH